MFDYPAELFLGADREIPGAIMQNLIDCYNPESRNRWIVEQWQFENLCRAVCDAALCYCLDAANGFERFPANYLQRRINETEQSMFALSDKPGEMDDFERLKYNDLATSWNTLIQAYRDLFGSEPEHS